MDPHSACPLMTTAGLIRVPRTSTLRTDGEAPAMICRAPVQLPTSEKWASSVARVTHAKVNVETKRLSPSARNMTSAARPVAPRMEGA